MSNPQNCPLCKICNCPAHIMKWAIFSFMADPFREIGNHMHESYISIQIKEKTLPTPSKT